MTIVAALIPGHGSPGLPGCKLDSRLALGEQFPESGLPELRLAGRRCGATHLRRATGRERGGVVRPERAARRRRMGCVDPPANQGLCAVRAGHLGQYAVPQRRVLPVGMETCGRPLAPDGRRPGVPVTGGDRRDARRERTRAGEIPRRAVDALVHRHVGNRICGACASTAVGRCCVSAGRTATRGAPPLRRQPPP